MRSHAEKKPSSWIKVTDLDEASAWITITNTTTMTPAKDTGAIEITELANAGMTLRAPATLCSVGHHLTLTVKLGKFNPTERGAEPRDVITFEATAKVTSEERFDTNSKIIVVQFFQFDDGHWKRLLERFAQRQNSALAIAKRMIE